VESKLFVLGVEGVTTGLSIQESSRGVTRSILLNYNDSSWLLGTVEELLSAKNSDVFWRRSRPGFPGIFAQRCANKHGRFLTVEDYEGGKRRGFILVPEGWKGEGWSAFQSELDSAVKFMKDQRLKMKIPMKKDHAVRSSETLSTSKPPVTQRRSFAETLASSSYVVPPKLLTRHSTNQKKMPEVKSVSLPEIRLPADVLKMDVPKPAAPHSVTVNYGKRCLDVSHACIPEISQNFVLRDTLERIRKDVETCLNWLDLGSFCGPSGSAPKSAIPLRPVNGDVTIKKNKCGLLGFRPKVSFKYNANSRGMGQGKGKRGLLGSRPKVYNTANARGLGQGEDKCGLLGSRPKTSFKSIAKTCGPITKPTRLEKGKAILVEDPKPKPKYVTKKWVKTQPGSMKVLSENPFQVLDRVIQMKSTASSSAVAPTGASSPGVPEFSPVTVEPVILDSFRCDPEPSPVVVPSSSAPHCYPEAPLGLLGEAVTPLLSADSSAIPSATSLSVSALNVGSEGLGLSVGCTPKGVTKPLESVSGPEMPELCLGRSKGGSEISQPSDEQPGWELAVAPDLEVSGFSVAAELVDSMEPLLNQSVGLYSSGEVLPSSSLGSLYSSCLDLDFSEDPSPLLCCPVNKTRGKSGAQSSEWVLKLAMIFSHLVGVSCDGYEGKLSALFEEIIASNSEKTFGSSPRASKKGMRELNNLFSSVNYDAHSGGTSRGRNKARVFKGHQ
jgi:hypothetical protein